MRGRNNRGKLNENLKPKQWSLRVDSIKVNRSNYWPGSDLHVYLFFAAHVANLFFLIYIFSVVVGPASSSNGDFGEWNAFPGGQMPASPQTVDNSGNDFFGAMTGGPATAPTPAPGPNPISAPGSGPASADLFDLMAPTQSLTSSQSLNFSMNSTQSMSTTVLPQSRSQVSMTALIRTHPS